MSSIYLFPVPGGREFQANHIQNLLLYWIQVVLCPFSHSHTMIFLQDYNATIISYMGVPSIQSRTSMYVKYVQLCTQAGKLRTNAKICFEMTKSVYASRIRVLHVNNIPKSLWVERGARSIPPRLSRMKSTGSGVLNALTMITMQVTML